MREDNGRLCIIGLDGATFAVLDQWLDAGCMPNLAGLVERGTRRQLISTVPPMTGPAWTTMTTGVNPGRHGIFDFSKWNEDGVSARWVQSGDVPLPRIWDLAGRQGRTVGVFRVPLTYPASEVNGFMVTGMLTPSPGPPMTHPATLFDELDRRGLCAMRPNPWGKSARRLAAHLFRSHVHTEQQLGYVLKRWRPDFLFCVFQDIDQFQHHLWPYCDRNTNGPDAFVRSLVARFFRRLDATIGRLVAYFGEEARFLVVSDHGFGPLRGKCCLNQYLARTGFLTVDWAGLRRGLARRRLLGGARAAFKALGLPDVPARAAARLKRRRRGGNGSDRREVALMFTPAVDWSRTTAAVMSATCQGIHVNVTGRGPHGIVEPGAEYDRVVSALIQALEGLRHPDTGEPLVTEIIRRDEIHHGPYVNEGPDLFVVLDDRAVDMSVHLLGPLVERRSRSGAHRPEGILIAAGPGVKAGTAAPAHISDVASTALYAMDLPVPDYMEGKVLTDLFEQAHVQAHPVRRSDEAPADVHAGQPRAKSTPQDDAALLDRMRRLGYV